jgi:hypothetical protein
MKQQRVGTIKTFSPPGVGKKVAIAVKPLVLLAMPGGEPDRQPNLDFSEIESRVEKLTVWTQTGAGMSIDVARKEAAWFGDVLSFTTLKSMQEASMSSAPRDLGAATTEPVHVYYAALARLALTTEEEFAPMEVKWLACLAGVSDTRIYKLQQEGRLKFENGKVDVKMAKQWMNGVRATASPVQPQNEWVIGERRFRAVVTMNGALSVTEINAAGHEIPVTDAMLQVEVVGRYLIESGALMRFAQQPST